MKSKAFWAQHVTNVKRSNGKFIAVCKCGWESKPQTRMELAERKEDGHILSLDDDA